MSNTALEKRTSGTIKEKAQYAGALGIIGVMLWVAGFPVFLLFFIGVLTFFIWKVFSTEGRNETRRIFEFYLTANEILREDDRRWYGFEVQEAIARGEHILKSMSAAPPLVAFSLGALYQKIEDHSSAVKYLSRVVDENAPKETAIVFPTRELRDYVRMLRKIERAPAEAPLTSSAIRALERARKNRGPKLLELSRSELSKESIPLPHSQQKLESIVEIEDIDDLADDGSSLEYRTEQVITSRPTFAAFNSLTTASNRSKNVEKESKERKTISEVLHDIYDENVQ